MTMVGGAEIKGIVRHFEEMDDPPCDLLALHASPAPQPDETADSAQNSQPEAGRRRFSSPPVGGLCPPGIQHRWLQEARQTDAFVAQSLAVEQIAPEVLCQPVVRREYNAGRTQGDFLMQVLTGKTT